MGAFPQHREGEAVEGAAFGSAFGLMSGGGSPTLTPPHPVSGAHPMAVEVEAGEESPVASGAEAGNSGPSREPCRKGGEGAVLRAPVAMSSQIIRAGAARTPLVPSHRAGSWRPALPDESILRDPFV
jgi:hypothetical protein